MLIVEYFKIFSYNKAMKNKKEIKKYAQEIIELEKKCIIFPNEKNNYLKQIEKIIENLSLEEIFIKLRTSSF